MSQIKSRIIWLPLLWESDKDSVTLLKNPPLAARGAEARVNIAIYESFGNFTADNPGTLFDITNLAAFILKIYSSSTFASGLLLDTSDAAAIAAAAAAGQQIISYDYTATATQFLNRQKAPIQIYLPGTLTAAITAGTNYASFTGATSENAAQSDWFGTAQWISKEVGLSTSPTPPTPAEEYVRADVFRAALDNKVSFGWNPNGKSIGLRNGDGSYGVMLRSGDNGELIPDPIPNP